LRARHWESAAARADLGRQGAVLEQQREQDGGISRQRIQRRVLLGGVDEYLTNGAVREITNVHPVTVTGVLDVERDRTAAMWQAPPGDHRAASIASVERTSAFA